MFLFLYDPLINLNITALFNSHLCNWKGAKKEGEKLSISTHWAETIQIQFLGLNHQIFFHSTETSSVNSIKERWAWNSLFDAMLDGEKWILCYHRIFFLNSQKKISSSKQCMNQRLQWSKWIASSKLSLIKKSHHPGGNMLVVHQWKKLY